MIKLNDEVLEGLQNFRHDDADLADKIKELHELLDAQFAPSVGLRLGALHRKLGENEDALDAFRFVTRSKADDYSRAKAHAEIATILSSKREYRLALEEVKRAQALAPDNDYADLMNSLRTGMGNAQPTRARRNAGQIRKLSVENPTDYKISVSVRISGAAPRTDEIPPGTLINYSVESEASTFEISFDKTFHPGYQPADYQVSEGATVYFDVDGLDITLYRH